MPKPVFALLFAALVPGILSGCGKSGPAPAATTGAGSPEAFLAWSMDQYHKAKSFSAVATVHISSLAFGMHAEEIRSISYQTPNRYLLTTTFSPTQAKLTCASDGKKEIDYSSSKEILASLMDAPTSIAEVKSPPLNDPTIGGTLLYRFFAGSGDIGTLEQQGIEPATWGPESTAPSGEKTKMVKFLAPGAYGHVEATIGATTGLVYKIAYDSAPAVKMMLNGQTAQEVVDRMKLSIPTLKPGKQRDAMQELANRGASAFTIVSLESYDHPSFDSSLSPALFDSSLPKGLKLAPPPPDGKPPVPLGSRAPDIVLLDSQGKTVKLSSLRGHIVLIDFWATWCGPCKEGLPVTAALAAQFEKKGLKVLAVTSEDQSKISQFLVQQTYKLPAYRDPGMAAGVKFHIDPLPTTVVIDAKGNLVDYMPGLRSPNEIANSLMRAGLDMSG